MGISYPGKNWNSNFNLSKHLVDYLLFAGSLTKEFFVDYWLIQIPRYNPTRPKEDRFEHYLTQILVKYVAILG